jgi:hypothetical protein
MCWSQPLVAVRDVAVEHLGETDAMLGVDETGDVKGQTGLDEHRCRTWTSWRRWATLVLLARAFLAAVTVTARAKPIQTGLIPLSLNEIRHLYDRLALASAADIPHILHWSRWRRRLQHRAQQAHYQQNARQKHELYDSSMPRHATLMGVAVGSAGGLAYQLAGGQPEPTGLAGRSILSPTPRTRTR